MMHQAERAVVVGARKVTPGGTSKLRLRRRVPTGNFKVRIPQSSASGKGACECRAG